MSEFDDVGLESEQPDEKVDEKVLAVPKKGKNVRGDITAKRAKAIENLAKGRAKRMANLKKKKEMLEYDIEDEGSDSDGEELVLSKKKKSPKNVDNLSKISEDMNDLKAVVVQLTKLQKKNLGGGKKSGTSIVINPASAPVVDTPRPAKPKGNYMDAYNKTVSGYKKTIMKQ